MKEHQEVTKSLTDALLEIHKELAADEAFLTSKLRRGGEIDLDEEKMRIQHVLSLAVLMEETIDSVLKELRQEKAEAEAKADFNVPELHHLEYDTHVIGTPDEGSENSVMEDISLDKEPEAEEEEARRVDEAVDLADEIADEAEKEAEEGATSGDTKPAEEPAEETAHSAAPEEKEDTPAAAPEAMAEEKAAKKAAEAKKKAEKKAKKEAKEKTEKDKNKKKKEKKSKQDEDDD